ncbi:piRNA biogenesis protein EXD1 isoform X2 [Corythoichthys intestinalis]|uniref:piRNA biogenesis protein EXD1 isoform X2 n=1 Tax=Corythoichthys intestinalis TaxID=161448 RepID=UPI0025A5A126|nr:piRNA biogenesis protein EXD1 isoform X2 [Corythoichthys intestinalis]
MLEDETQFVRLFQGKRVKLTLRTSSFIGVVQHINCTEKTVVLTNVVCGDNGCEILGRRLFYGHEILNVEFEGSVEYGTLTEYLDNQMKVKQFQPYRNTIYHVDEEDEYIHFEVIDGFDEKFGPAVMTIKQQQVVSVGADGVEIFKHGRLCWLQIATKKQVYLFDILLLGAKAFKNGLSMILENKRILKVIHDCRLIAGCLMTQFGVKLTNVFDTQVADVLCFHSETGGYLPHRVSTLQEVEDSELWYTRPCPLPILKVMVLSVIHLQPLRMVLLDSLLTDYMAIVDTFLLNSLYPLDDLQSITLENMFDLPAELMQLEKMRCERREHAIKLYPVTDKGLLVRSSPQREPEPQPQTSSSAEELQCTEPTVEPLPTEVENSSLPTLNVVPLEGVVNTFSEPVREMPLSNAGRGFTSLLMGVMGRGRDFGKGQPVTSTHPLPDSDANSTNP